MSSDPLTGDGQFRNQIVRIAELTVTSGWIENTTFSNCQIIGPAVLVLQDNVNINHCDFEAEIDAMFWEIPSARDVVVGAVGVRNCEFSRCVFKAVGFAGPPELRDQFAQGLRDTH